MVEGPGGARLAVEPMDEVGRRQRGVDHLDGDVAAQPRVARAIDLAHAAGPEASDDLVGAEAIAGGEAYGILRGGSLT